MANTHSLDLESGSNQYAAVADVSQTGLDLSGDFTFECWVNFESLPSSTSSMMLISKDNASTQRSYEFFLYNSSGTYQLHTIMWQTGAASYDQVSVDWTPSVGVWYHLAVTCDVSNAVATEFEFFVNGSSIGNGTTVNDGGVTEINNSSAEFAIGRRGDGLYYDGLIDEVRVWNDIRTSIEIVSNKDKQLVGDETGLVGYWKFNNDYLDETSNNNDLTSSGSPVFSTTVPFTEGGFIAIL